MSSQASADFIWRVVKGNNAFLRKQKHGRGSEGIKLSTEKGNLTATSCFKFSGVAHKGLDMQIGENGVSFCRGFKTITVPTKKSKGTAAHICRKGRKDLKRAAQAKSQRLSRLATRKTRKTWKSE
eukprot:TRINITY_DN48417_c0_g1_i1.p1 TRINITY_DN48417_c0_g1~~TRINITY_DN48417_c0_g1_i1.p1  ORF type:complete len:142 (+),score=44.33 TRINITY_DN48417_c0_g1_i1:52-426(+)